MATNNSGWNSTYLLMSDGKGNEERGREQELQAKSQLTEFEWKMYAASGDLFTDS